MQSINTGKQNSSFSWYSSNLPVTSIQVAKSEHSVSSEIPVSLVEGFKPISIKYDASPKILESARSVISMEDRIQASKSPKEPSRINKPIQSRLPLEGVSHVAEKHSFTSSSPAAVPLKRAKIGMDKEIVDLEQSVDTLSLIEQERQSRIMSGANPVISGKMYNVQKEFMSQVQKSPYESFWQKGTEYYQSARKYLVSSNQQKVVGKIHRFSDHVETFEENGEMITFVWPRITSEIKAAEETARLERSTVDPVLFGKWKAINDEVKSMVASTHRSGLAQYDGQIIGRAAQAIDDAIHYTASLFASFGFFSRSYDANWSRVLEEKERARRINNFSVDPMLDARKARVESELLKTVNAL